MFKLSDEIKGFEGELLSDGFFETINYCTKDVGRPFLCFMQSEKFIERIDENVSCVLCTEELRDKLPEQVRGIFVCEEPKAVFHEILIAQANRPREKAETVIGENCNISEMAYIAPKNVKIGNNVTIEPFVTVKEGVEIGDNAIIRSGATIGSKAFSFTRKKDGTALGIPDMGTVVIENNVEVYCGSVIDRGLLESDCTRIGAYTKIDSLCEVGHGAIVGKRVFIAEGTVIGGNCTVGDDVWFGVNTTIANRINIGNNVRVNIGAVVTKDIEDGEHVSGNFAIKHSSFIKYIKELSQKYKD